MLCNGPLGHLECSSSSKEQGRQGAGSYSEEHPAKALHGVVGAGDVLKQEAMGYDIRLLTRRPQICQNDMTPAQRYVGPKELLEGWLKDPRLKHLDNTKLGIACSPLTASRPAQFLARHLPSSCESGINHGLTLKFNGRACPMSVPRDDKLDWPDSPEVSSLAEEGDSKEGNGPVAGRLSVQGVIDEISHISSKAPVV